MPIDKRMLREALAEYQAWNEAEFIDRVRSAGRKSPDEKWQEYCALYAFGRRIKPQPSRMAEEQKAKEWNEYYRRMEQFEAWRRSRG